MRLEGQAAQLMDGVAAANPMQALELVVRKRTLNHIGTTLHCKDHLDINL